ncbi:MAG: thiamine pyrophosphate-binding protein [Haloarculaceae archaeon]
MSHTGADLFVEALSEYGITHLFGNPGTTELPIMKAVGDGDVEYVLALHEDVAVGMASGYAKTLRWHAYEDGEAAALPVGVVNLHVAPGVAHGLGNMFDSGHIGTGAPIVVTAGAHGGDHQHREPNLHADLVAMTDQFTKWSAEVKDVAAMPTMLRRAVRVAATPPTGPVFLALPFDVVTAETDATPERLGSIPDAGDADPGAVADAADVVVEADDVVMIVGDLLARAGPRAVAAAVEFAEASGARVHGEFRGSEVAFPTDHAAWGGGLPDDRERATELMAADALVLAGTVSNVPTNPFDVPEGLPAGTTSVHVSNSARELGKNYVADVAALGDPGRILRRLAERISGRISDAERARRVEARMAPVPDDDSPAGSADGGDDGDGRPGASKAQLADAVVAAAPDARVVAESTTSVGALRARRDFAPGHFFNFRGGGLGYGLPAALGTALAEGTRDEPTEVIGFVGDGAYLYYDNAIYTAARYGIDLTVVVCDNRNYRILKDNTIAIFGGDDDDHEYVGMDFDPHVDIPKSAESHGAASRQVTDPDAIRPAVADALEEDGPTVLDVLIHD